MNLNHGLRSVAPTRDLAEAAPATRARDHVVVRHFLAQRERPTELGPVDVATLAPHQRALLVGDGTMVSSLEAHLFEALAVDPLDQRSVPISDRDGRWLDVAAGTTVLRRRIVIRGAASHRLHVCAQSILIPERLPPDFLRALRTDSRGLGSVLREATAMSRRELLWFGRRTRPGWATGVLPARPMVSRTYRLVLATGPSILISEDFPW